MTCRVADASVPRQFGLGNATTEITELTEVSF